MRTERIHPLLPTHDEIMEMFPDGNFINITDIRDIKEIERRKKTKTCQPYRDELYSINPNFNGIYTDPGRLTKDGKKMKSYSMGFIH